MDGGGEAGEVGGSDDARRKRPHPSDYSGNPAQRQRVATSSTRPLSLLAGCALNQENSAGRLAMMEAQHQRLQLPSGQLLQERAAPSGTVVQNTPLLPGQSVIPAVQTPQHLAAMQSQAAGSALAGTSGLLRPFGMSPQELLNYAVLVNIVDNSITEGNAAISQMAFNRSQSISQSLIRDEANVAAAMDGRRPSNFQTVGNGAQVGRSDIAATFGGTDGSGPPGLPQRQGVNETALLARPNHNNHGTNGRNGDLAGISTQPINQPRDCTDTRTFTGATSTFHDSRPLAQHPLPTERRVPLATAEDEQRLSTQQCWLRKQIETFPAAAKDRTRGRNRFVDIGQIGIQCKHCKRLPISGRGNGATYFPASISRIYQSAQNMLALHFKEDTCPLIPRRLLQEMREAGETSSINPRMAPKAGKARAGGGKAFWEQAARQVLVDTTVGIRYSNDLQFQPLESIGESDQSNVADSFHTDGSILTHVEDKSTVTDFCFILMSQFAPYCKATTPPKRDSMGDEWDSDVEKGEAVPSIGVMCKFCHGESEGKKRSGGIFLSSKADTMGRNKNLSRMYSHLLGCAPEALKTKLMQAKNIHLPQSDRLKKGWKKLFFERVCERLIESLPELDATH